MKANVIIVSVEKSNKSENNVWAVAIKSEEQAESQAYCKSAYKAMRFAFLLKKQTGFSIEDDSLKMLSEQIASEKAAKAAAEAEEPKEAKPEPEKPEAEAKPKKQRKPRTKKVQAEPQTIAQVAEQAGLIAFL